MKVVLLAGGWGTRIAEESELRPKPMGEIGGMPILWHIMKGSSPMYFRIRRIREPVIVWRPVSTTVTLHGSVC